MIRMFMEYTQLKVYRIQQNTQKYYLDINIKITAILLIL